MMPYRQLAGFALLGIALALPASAQAQDPPLNTLLAKSAQQVSTFLDQFSQVKCTEQVTQEKLGKNGKTVYQEAATFDYLVILSSAGGELTLDESRLEERGGKHKQNLPLLVTNGFATLFLVFHPYYQASFEFTDQGDDVLEGKHLRKVHFQHIKGTRSTTALLLRSREYPLDISGTAWIDPQSGTIARMTAGLDEGMEDVGLRTLRSDVQYAPVPFKDIEKTFWFPATATIEVETPRQHWRNTHHFTDYKEFSVSTEETVKFQK